MSSDNKPNISVTGGPGKPHNSDGTSSTSSTGGTGGTGYTGGSGASGLGGEVGKAIDSIMNMEESVETYAMKVVYAGLYGATGGQGQPALDEAIKDTESFSALSKKFSVQIESMKETDAILKEFKECQKTLDLVTSKTNAVNAYYAFMQGTRLLKLQRIRGNEKNWIEWIGEALPDLKKRTREKYMSLAAVPLVEKHLEYGVERLAEFGTIYSLKSQKDRDEMGPDPLGFYLKDNDLDEEASYEDRKNLFDAKLVLKTLNRMGLEFPLDVMDAFLRKQAALTSRELKYLVKLGKEEAVSLLERIIAGALERKNFIEATDNPGESSQDTPAGVGPNDTLTGPNIEMQVYTLCKSLESANTPLGIKLDHPVDRDQLIQLKNYIDQLLAMDQGVQDAAA